MVSQRQRPYVVNIQGADLPDLGFFREGGGGGCRFSTGQKSKKSFLGTFCNMLTKSRVFAARALPSKLKIIICRRWRLNQAMETKSMETK